MCGEGRGQTKPHVADSGVELDLPQFGVFGHHQLHRRPQDREQREEQCNSDEWVCDIWHRQTGVSRPDHDECWFSECSAQTTTPIKHQRSEENYFVVVVLQGNGRRARRACLDASEPGTTYGERFPPVHGRRPFLSLSFDFLELFCFALWSLLVVSVHFN